MSMMLVPALNSDNENAIMYIRKVKRDTTESNKNTYFFKKHQAYCPYYCALMFNIIPT